MSDNTFAHSTTRRPLTRVATGIGVTLAAIATIGLGAGAAAAAPQQPFAADDPIPGMPGAGSAVNIANSLFGSLSGLMNNVIPGAGDLLMPATGALGGGGGLPGGLPGGLGGLPGGLGGLPGGVPGGLPGGMPGGLPGGIPGQTPGLGGYPGGLPGQTLPGQTPGGFPGQMPGGLPGQTPGYPGGLPGQTLPGQLPGQTPGGLRSRAPRTGARRPRPGSAGAGPAGRPAGSCLVGERQRRHPGARAGGVAVGLHRQRHERLIDKQNCKEDQSWPSEAGKSATASTARPITASGPTLNQPLNSTKTRTVRQAARVFVLGSSVFLACDVAGLTDRG